MATSSSRGAASTPCLETTASRQDPIETVVLEAVSRESGTDVLELPPLEREVEADVLEAMFRELQTDWRLSFRYYGYSVVVDADRSVALFDVE